MIRDEVAPDQHLAEVPRELSVDVLLRGRELQVHVRVGGHQEPLVLHAPLELDDDGFARELVEERLGVDGHGCGHRVCVCVLRARVQSTVCAGVCTWTGGE